MSATGLLGELRARGFVLAAAGDRLRVDAPADALTPELRDRLAADKPRLLAELECEQAWAEVERTADAGNVKVSAALALDAAGAHDEAEQLRAEVREMVSLEWLPAMRRWARAADRAGQLPDADRFLLDDPDVEAAAAGWRRVPGGGWAETEERSRRCVVHADRALAPGDRLYCPECRIGADAPAPRGWQCVCHSTERRYREQWGDWVCAREQCGMIAPSPRDRP